ncbi:uncharacterized protein E0L32_000822 [Thyridium curvatum]|uniref:Glucose-methanol-choline oxidoreductase C-terminal domain-containing protein n=1 Tax=Thyridium curvatum TaxID=1093900 RepID=A0A507AP40_9PEZI|nr:uncharacterized protein E0L32_000822 [Thyridium curvatum]TPX12645.1 hypothetical protein E0L32_000822 [Thyridium curvatum]
MKFYKTVFDLDFAPYGPVETAPGIGVEGAELEDWIRRVIIPTHFYPITTAAKKPKECGGVVAEDLTSHGTQRLSMADASILPMFPGTNTQQPTYMVAEKVIAFP